MASDLPRCADDAALSTGVDVALGTHTVTVFAPVVPKGDLPGCEQLNKSSFALPLFYQDAPELMEQYVKAFEKVWASKAELAAL